MSPIYCTICILYPICKRYIIEITREVIIMPASKAQQKAVAKYMANNYDEIKVRVPKGKKKKIKAHAESKGESLNGFVNRAIDETVKRDNDE